LKRHKILVVDDEAPNLRLLQRVLGQEQEVLTASGGAQALELLAQHEISLIISDQRMPEMTGVQLLEKSIAVRPHAIKILLTGYTDVQALIDAINAGKVYKYIPKPWDPDDLRLTVKRALEAYELKEDNDKLLLDLRGALCDLEDISMGTIRALADALDAKCDYTAGHSVRVSRFALGIGRTLGLTNEQLRNLELGGILHDIGKIGVPESILWKPSKLTVEEQLIMSEHPRRSAQIIGELKSLSLAKDYVEHHHECMDGSGYPDHLVGEGIPLGSRIILVADAYDAMTTDRPYRPAIGHSRALIELRKNIGRQFDPVLVEALISAVGETGELIKDQLPASVLGLSLSVFESERPQKRPPAEFEPQGHVCRHGLTQVEASHFDNPAANR
jgi:putative two-component system response regulator